MIRRIAVKARRLQDTPLHLVIVCTQNVHVRVMMKTALYEWLVISLYVLYKLTEQILKLSSRLLCILDRNRRTIGEMELAKIAKSLVRCVTTGEVRVCLIIR